MAKKHKILLVEDEKSITVPFLVKLKASGFDVTDVYDGDAAMKALEDNDFDLILLDLMLPKLDGFEVLERIKEERIETPVVVVSNLGQKEDIEHAKELGVKDYIVKTRTSLTEIVSRVEKLLK